MKRPLSVLAFMAMYSMVVCMEELQRISDPEKKICKKLPVTCPCGDSGENFIATFETCFQPDNGTAVSDIDQLRIRRYCTKFVNCKTCPSDGENRCETCPEGKTGKFCSKDTSVSNSRSHFRHFTKRNLCAIPTYMDTNSYHCYQKKYTITCVQNCDDGHAFPDGADREIRCDRHIGIWLPHGFRECDYNKFTQCAETDGLSKQKRSAPCEEQRKKRETSNSTAIKRKKRGLCAVPSFMETNTYTCDETKRRIACHQTCNEGHTFEEGSKRTIKCDKFVGNWRPKNFEQCIKVRRTKRELCAVPEFMSTNTFECKENNVDIQCTQTCLKGFSFPQKTNRTITCSKDTGLWKPGHFEECTRSYNAIYP